MRQGLRVIIGLLFIITTALGSFSIGYGEVRIKIAVSFSPKDIASLPLTVGIKKCFFVEEGLDPVTSYESYEVSPSLGVDLLDNKEMDYYIGPPSQIAGFAAIRKLPIRIIFFYFTRGFFYLMVQPNINSVEDLEGKTIAIDFFNSTIDYAVKRTLERHGLDPEDVTILPVEDVMKRFVGLRTKSFHAAVLPLPLNISAQQYGLHELRDFREQIVPSLALATTEDKIKSNPGEVESMLKVARKSLLYTKEYKDDVEDIMQQLTELADREIIDKIYRSLIEGLSPNGNVDEKSLNTLIKQAREQFDIEDKILVGVFNLNLLEDILRTQHLIVIAVAEQCTTPIRRAVRWDFWYWLTHNAGVVTATVLPSQDRKVVWEAERRNLLRRPEPYKFSWDGRHQRTKQYVEQGEYICRIEVTDNEHRFQMRFHIR